MTQSTPKLNNERAFTDVIFQEFFLYIEGVQVPFTGMSISSGDGALPSATIQVPPMPGLMDIAKYYSPKVHIFYKDKIDGYDEQRLLFSGIITGVSYSKSLDWNSPSKTLEFSCAHKYSVLSNFLIDYTGWKEMTGNPNTEGAVNPAAYNSLDSLSQALQGLVGGIKSEKAISADTPSGDVTVCPKYLEEFYSRLKGMPGIMVNYWNQLKRDSLNPEFKEYSDSFVKMYLPLVEEGLKLFQRTAGHAHIEDQIEEARQDYLCKSETRSSLVPPSLRLFFSNSIQVEMAYRTMQNALQGSGEVTNLYQLFSSFYESIDYDIVTLASPAENYQYKDKNTMVDLASPSYAVDTIVKPQIPFYYAPSCNLLLPGMYTSVNVRYDEYNIPSRVELRNNENPTNPNETLAISRIRAPASIRRSVAFSSSPGSSNPDLVAAFGPSKGTVGAFEWGRGIKNDISFMPNWVSLFSQSRYSGTNSNTWNVTDADASALDALSKGWEKRYPGESNLNPWSQDSGLQPHQRLLVQTADFQYTKMVARSKAGTVQCPFNPYIIPGYPIDILEASPTDPSFHAHCQSVTHSISPSSCSTTVTFVAAMTYSELTNYYVPFVHPWLQTSLGLADQATIVANEAGKANADLFYKDIFGNNVNAIAPEEVYDFSTGTVKPLKRAPDGFLVDEGSTQSDISSENGGELNLNLSYEGNMYLVYREIESRSSIEGRDDISFISLEPENYTSVVFQYNNKVIDEAQKFELGQSPFLTYDTVH